MGHTPGPWYANQDCIEIDGPEGPRDVTLAVVLKPDNAAADAHLIAAAPELLAALKRAVSEANCAMGYSGVDAEHTLKRVLERASKLTRVCETAIAKAEGRSE